MVSSLRDLVECAGLGAFGFAAFYAVFPAFCRFTAGLGGRSLLSLVVVLAVLSWLPMGLYLLVDPAGDAWTALQSCSGARG